ncbi:type IV pilin protein [Rhodoferax sp. GW822-FHT02A01]|uniref:type IV pilin protein n=1 Tax=Rhodoferax sp. GW822-FHT02A01 TaxID=3141537 RepID=UPI00315CDEE6
MVTVAILGILASVAYPAYTSYLRKGNRANAEAYMMDLALREQQYFTDSKSYAYTVTALNDPVPSNLVRYYSFAITTNPNQPSGSTVPTFVITATAIGSQSSDGPLTLDNTGNKTPTGYW